MSQENVEIVEQFNSAFNAHDIERWSSFLGSEFEFVDHMGAVGEDFGSRAELARQVQGWFASFPDFRAEIEEFIDAGDRVVSVTRWRGTGAASGLPYDIASAEISTLNEGQIIRLELGFADRAAALKVVGLEE